MRFFVIPLLLSICFVAAQVNFDDLTGEYTLVHAGISFCGERLSLKVVGNELNSLVFDNSTEPCTIQSPVLTRGQLKENHPNRDQLGTGVWTTTPLECGGSGETIMDVYKPLETFSYKIESLKAVLHKAGTKYVHLVRKAPRAWCVYHESGAGSFSSRTPPPEPGSQERLTSPAAPASPRGSETVQTSSNSTTNTTTETGDSTSTPPSRDSDSGIAPRSPDVGTNTSSPSPTNGTHAFPSSSTPQNDTNPTVSSPDSSTNTTSPLPINDTNNSTSSDSNTNNVSSPPTNGTNNSGSSSNSSASTESPPRKTRTNTSGSSPNSSPNTNSPPPKNNTNIGAGSPNSSTDSDYPRPKPNANTGGSSSNPSGKPTATEDTNLIGKKPDDRAKNETKNASLNETAATPKPVQKPAPSVEVLWLWLGPVIGALSTIIGAFITVWCVQSRNASKNDSNVQVHLFTSDYNRTGNEGMSLETLNTEKTNPIHRIY